MYNKGNGIMDKLLKDNCPNINKGGKLSVGNYIRYHEAETLFKIYPTLQVILKSLEVDLQNLKANSNIDDEIYTQAIGNHEGNSLPPIGSISDKTGNIAIRLRHNLYLDRKKLTKDINELSAVIDKLNYAITSMKTVQRLVLETYYWSEQNTWKQVIDVLNKEGYFMSRSKAVKVRSSAINYIVTVSKVTTEQYQFVMGLVE